MTRSAGELCTGRLHEANFCAFHTPEENQRPVGKEKRGATRFVYEEPVVLETQAGDFIGAVVMNYSKNGLYFESDVKVAQGAILRIRNESTLSNINDGGCCAEVRWSRRLGRETTEYQFGTGARYC